MTSGSDNKTTFLEIADDFCKAAQQVLRESIDEEEINLASNILGHTTLYYSRVARRRIEKERPQ